MTKTITNIHFADWHFAGNWHRYQQMGLEVFEEDRLHGDRKTLIVAPPGSGKTLLGLEIIRRLDTPALVLAPTQLITQQWLDKQEMFGARSEHLHAFTYQALCQTTDPDNLLRDLAEKRWVRDRAKAASQTVVEVEQDTALWKGAAARRRKREIARIVARLKRHALHEGLDDVESTDLLSDNVYAHINRLKEAGVKTLVVDECHHLTGLWGAILAIVIKELGIEHIVALTATNPTTLGRREAKLYEKIVGKTDFQIPAPAVVREGHLAPYQELVQIVEPLQSELEWLSARHERFQEMLLQLDESPDDLRLSVWLLTRLQERRGGDGTQTTWQQFARQHPKLAQAGLRWLHENGKRFPDGAPRGEMFEVPVSVEDWIVLLNDYAMGCLKASHRGSASDRLAFMQVGLGDLGFTVTRRGIRATASEVDNVLLNSAAKPIALCDILDIELTSRNDALRAVVLCDTLHGPKQPVSSPLALSGGARGALSAVGNDVRLEMLRPVMLTAEMFAVLSEDCQWWTQHLLEMAAADGIIFKGEFIVEEDGPVSVLTHPDSQFCSRNWTAWATDFLSSGKTRLLIGTRGLLGEGWDCPQTNVVVDLTCVAADVSVRQMRGRSLRKDPQDPDKVSCNWDVVCVAPELSRGHADYHRFVRRHQHIHAPCEDGVIETGPSHVHPSLSPYQPPATEHFDAINQEQRERAADLDGARERWGIGKPYEGKEVEVLVVRKNSEHSTNTPKPSARLQPIRRRWFEHNPYAPVTLWGRRRRHLLFPENLPLDWAAGIICDTYKDLGLLSHDAYMSLTISPRPDGWLRISMPQGSKKENILLLNTIRELLEDPVAPTHMVSRIACADSSRFTDFTEIWCAVPSSFSSVQKRAAFFRVWQQWCGESQFIEGTDTTGKTEGSYKTTERTVWL